jgi:hypothetical protein
MVGPVGYDHLRKRCPEPRYVGVPKRRLQPRARDHLGDLGRRAAASAAGSGRVRAVGRAAAGSGTGIRPSILRLLRHAQSDRLVLESVVGTEPPLGTQYVSDGVLHLVGRRSDGYPNLTVSSEPCGQRNPQSFGEATSRHGCTGPACRVQAQPSGSSRPSTRPIRGGRSWPAWSQPACRPRSTCSRDTGTTSTSSPARSAAIRSAATANRIG